MALPLPLRFAEFFRDDNERMSMTRLMLFLSFFPASYLAIEINDSDALMWYLGAYAALAGNNKWVEARNVNSNEILETDGDSAGNDGSLGTRQHDGKPQVRNAKTGIHSKRGKAK